MVSFAGNNIPPAINFPPLSLSLIPFHLLPLPQVIKFHRLVQRREEEGVLSTSTAPLSSSHQLKKYAKELNSPPRTSHHPPSSELHYQHVGRILMLLAMD